MGKVHGSLARAGKVKSQTPKVRLPPLEQPSVTTFLALFHLRNSKLT